MGSETADKRIEALMHEYGNDVLRMAYMYVRNEEVAKDMFQDVFIKAYKGIDGFKGDSSIKTWLLSITINTCKDYLKSAYHNKVVPLEDFAEDSLVTRSDFSRLERAESAKKVRDAVAGLPEEFRDVVISVYFNGRDMKETAALLKISEGTVKSRLYRAKEKLKKVLDE